MEVVEVTNKHLLNLFLAAPVCILKKYPHYIAPIRSTVKDTLSELKNPLWQVAEKKLFIAFKNNKPVGTIATIYHSKHVKYNQEDAVYFGYLHFEDNAEVLHVLITAAKAFALQKGIKMLIGPFNPSLNYELGILTDGFNYNPSFMMNYNPPYYPLLLEKEGGKTSMQFFAYTYQQKVKIEKIERVAQLLRKRYDIKIVDIDFRNFDAEAYELCEIYNDAFKGHFGFVPFSNEEFLFLAKALRQVLNQQLLFKVKINNIVAGFILTIPDINPAIKKLRNGRFTPWNILRFINHIRKINSTKVMLVAIRKHYQKYGLGSILYSEMNKRTVKAGYEQGEISWVAAENKNMQKIIESTGAQLYKKYSIYKFDV